MKSKLRVGRWQAELLRLQIEFRIILRRNNF
jgi:hypothetical protein